MEFRGDDSTGVAVRCHGRAEKGGWFRRHGGHPCRRRAPRHLDLQPLSGVPGGVLGDIGKRFEFDENQMAKPVMVSGRQIQYTDQAIEREVEGTIVVKCVLSVDGAVRDCRVLRGLPFMDRAAVEALQSWRYRPVLFHGQPVDVDYTFRIKLSLPR